MALTRITKGVIKPNENYDTHNINSTGIVTAIGLDVNGNGDISGNLNVGGILTYEDVTSIDSVGIITARDGIHVGAGVSAVGVGTFGSLDISGDIDVDGHTNLDNISVSGISTFSGIVDALNTPASIRVAQDIQHKGNANTKISFPTNDEISFDTSGHDRIYIKSNGKIGINTSNPSKLVTIKADAPFLRLEAADTSDKRLDLQVSTSGIATISAEQSSQQLSFRTTGGEALRIASNGNVSVFQDLDVDGHTNLDNVSVAGVTTFTDDVYFDGATADRDIIFDRSANTLQVKPNAILKIGQGSYATNIYTNGVNTILDHNQNSGLFIKTNSFLIYGTGTSSGNTYDGTIFRAYQGKVELGYEVPNGGTTTLDNLVTTPKGVTVGTGVTIERNGQATFTGIVTASAYYGDGSNLTGIAKIFEGNTEVETVDTGSDGHVKITTEGVESFRVDSRGYFNLGRDYSSNPQNGLVGITTIRGHRVNEAGDYSQLYFKNSTVSGNSSASIRAYRDGGNYNTGLSFYTHYSTSSGGDGTERFFINSTGRVVKQIFSSNQTYAANDTTQLGYQSQNISDVANTYTALRLTAGSTSPATAQLSSIRTGAGENDFTIQLESGNTAFEALRIKSDGNVDIGGGTHSRNLTVHAATNSVILIEGASNGTSNLMFGDENDEDVGMLGYNHASNYLAFTVNTEERLRITSSGEVNIGGDYAQTTYKMKVSGSFAATTKSFVIDHPTKENHQLRYACLEGPENSVYIRGRSSDPVIELPDYWTGLVHEDSITVNVTPIGNHKVWVESINNNSITIGSDGSEYFYTVFAERKDVDKLEVEVAK